MQDGSQLAVNIQNANRQNENHLHLLLNDEQGNREVLRRQWPLERKVGTRCRPSALHLLLHNRGSQSQPPAHPHVHSG